MHEVVPPELLEVAKVAILLKTSPDFVRRLIREHRLPAVQLSTRVWRVDRADLTAYIEACRTAHRRPDDDRSEVRTSVVLDHQVTPMKAKARA